MAERPFVTLKLATSLDGRIATASGESRWITGPAAREAVHRLRAEHDAIMVGYRTAVIDDPELSIRTPDFEGDQPIRLVIDARQQLDVGSKLVAGARRQPTWVVSVEPPKAILVEAGVQVIQVAGYSRFSHPNPRVDLEVALAALWARGVRRIFLEGGGELAASFVNLGFVDQVEWFRSPIVLGADAGSAIGWLSLAHLADAPRFRRLAVEAIGDDIWERYTAGMVPLGDHFSDLETN